jgi:hypothetical protein
LNSLHSRIICTKFDSIWPAGSGEKFSKFSVHFHTFAIISPWRGAIPPFFNKLESPSTKDDLCQVWLKLAQWFWRRRFLNDPTPFLHFCDYLPFEEDLALYLNKLVSPSPKDDLYLIELCPVVLVKKIFFKNSMFFLLFPYYHPFEKDHPLEKGNPLPLNKPESPPSKDDLCQVWLKLAQWFWRRSRKCKSLQTDRQTDGQTDGRQQGTIRRAQLSFQLR